MDDVLAIIENDETTHFKSFLNNKFKIKDLRELKLFLELEVFRTSAGNTLNHKKYALDILSNTSYLDAKLVITPRDSKLKLSKDESEVLPDAQQYKKLIGKLLYLTSVRPATPLQCSSLI